LYVVAVPEPRPDWEKLYLRYSSTKDPLNKSEILSSLLERLGASGETVEIRTCSWGHE
jgi:hypothetical protein